MLDLLNSAAEPIASLKNLAHKLNDSQIQLFHESSGAVHQKPVTVTAVDNSNLQFLLLSAGSHKDENSDLVSHFQHD